MGIYDLSKRTTRISIFFFKVFLRGIEQQNVWFRKEKNAEFLTAKLPSVDVITFKFRAEGNCQTPRQSGGIFEDRLQQMSSLDLICVPSEQSSLQGSSNVLLVRYDTENNIHGFLTSSFCAPSHLAWI